MDFMLNDSGFWIIILCKKIKFIEVQQEIHEARDNEAKQKLN